MIYMIHISGNLNVTKSNNKGLVYHGMFSFPSLNCYPGYTEELIASEPDKFEWELSEFKGQFSTRN
jgi:hypothetical protein